MKSLKSYAARHPVVFAASLTIVWLILLLGLTALASGALGRPYGDAVTSTVGRLVTTAGVLWLLWRLGWLASSGVARLGRWQVWLIALGGLAYYAWASLYSFYGEAAFDLSNLVASPDSPPVVITSFAASLCEELLFRGLVLHSLARAWGDTKQGMLASVALAALLFAVLHFLQVFTSGVPLSAALLLIVQAWIIAIWWGALVVWGGSIWPAVLLHFAGNAAVALQGLVTPMIEPDLFAYRHLLWFSILLGLLAAGLIVWAVPRRNAPAWFSWKDRGGVHE